MFFFFFFNSVIQNMGGYVSKKVVCVRLALRVRSSELEKAHNDLVSKKVWDKVCIHVLAASYPSV